MPPPKVNYVARCHTFCRSGYPYTGVLRLLKVALNYDYLWINLRAYGCMSAITGSHWGQFVSYQNPNMKETNDIEGMCPNIWKVSMRTRDMTKYVIGTISELDTPLTPSQKGTRGLAAWYSRTDGRDGPEGEG